MLSKCSRGHTELSPEGGIIHFINCTIDKPDDPVDFYKNVIACKNQSAFTFSFTFGLVSSKLNKTYRH